MKKTVLVGATPNPARYAYVAAGRLTGSGHEWVPLGIKKGVIFGKEILDIRTRPPISDVDTVTLYIGPDHQREWYDYLLSLKPRRILFNPGAENPEFEKMAAARGIEAEEACTLVLLRTGQY